MTTRPGGKKLGYASEYAERMARRMTVRILWKLASYHNSNGVIMPAMKLDGKSIEVYVVDGVVLLSIGIIRTVTMAMPPMRQ